MDFVEELPTEIAILDTAWQKYESSNDTILGALLQSVDSWRWASGGMFPEHPLFGQADTTRPAEPWTEFNERWITEDDPKPETIYASQHGFDTENRIIGQQKKRFGRAYLYEDAYCDEFGFEKNEDGTLVANEEQVRRFYYDSNGRIERIASYTNEYGTKYYKVERFEYQNAVCTESVSQHYVVMEKIPQYRANDPEEDLRNDYRPLNGDAIVNNLVETVYRRRRFKYTYDSGALVRAEVFRQDGKADDQLLFERKPQRSIGEISEDLASKSVAAIIKVLKKRGSGKPYQVVALIYSAEHAYCGLPHTVKCVLSEEPMPADLQDWESYQTVLSVSFKRPVLSCLTEFSQRCSAEFGIGSMHAEAMAATKVMQMIAQQVVSEIKGTKHVTDDFRVTYIDDHGDVESGEAS